MTLHEAQQQLYMQLSELYDAGEAQQIADMAMDHITGWKRTDRVVNKNMKLLPDALANFGRIGEELRQHKPIQYILNEAWFAGMKFYVDENVLIPRPETEELVDWILKDISKNHATGKGISLIDIGTGSGCIPISIKKNAINASVYAIDVSLDALEVARKNAMLLDAEIQFLPSDILSEDARAGLPRVDIIVSNPPYVPAADKETMHPNVLKFEPWLALFVHDDDPYLFYRAIAAFAKEHLLPGGSVYVEIHEELSQGVVGIFKEAGYTHFEVRKDMQGKDRMVKIS